MVALREKNSEAIESLTKGLSAIPSVREAYVKAHFDEIDLWASVNGPLLEAQEQVINEACDVMVRLENVFIRCHVMPDSDFANAHRSPGAVRLQLR